MHFFRRKVHQNTPHLVVILEKLLIRCILPLKFVFGIKTAKKIIYFFMKRIKNRQILQFYYTFEVHFLVAWCIFAPQYTGA